MEEEEGKKSPFGSDEEQDPRGSSSSLTVENVRLHTEQAKKRRDSTSSKDSQPLSPLSPLKTPASNPSAQSSVVSDITGSNRTDEKDLQLPKKKPLPPIGVTDDDELEEQQRKGSASTEFSIPRPSSFFKGEAKTTIDDAASIKSGVSMKSGMSAKSTESRTSSKRTVSFADGEPTKLKVSKKESTIANKEVTKRKGADGKEFVVISIDAQTEWSWLEDLKSVGKSALSDPTPVTKTDQSPRPALYTHRLSFEGKLPPSSLTQKCASRLTEESSSESSIDDDLVEDESGTTKSKSGPSTPSGGSSAQDDVVAYPQPAVSDAYGIPLLELSSDSDFSDDDSESEPPVEGEDSDIVQGIGPPQILQYKRESEDQPPQVNNPRLLAPSPGQDTDNISSYDQMFSAPCEYCGNQVKPFPTLEQQDSQPPEDLYCCDKYREFVHFTLTHPLNDQLKEDKEIDIAPHPPHGSKLARRAAKERAAQRMREREMQRQQAAAAAMSTGAAPTNFFSFARQMKTINYQLSSQRCLEEGWTVRIPSPLMEDDNEPNVFIAEPLSEFGDDDEYQFIDLMGQSHVDGDTSRREDSNRTDLGGKKQHAKSSNVEGRTTKRGRDSTLPGVDERQGGDESRGRKSKQGKQTGNKDSLQGGDGVQKKGRKGGVKSFSLQRPDDAEVSQGESTEVESPRKLALKALARAKRRMLRQWYYPDGTKFLTVFPDGSGNVFYPSGSVAITISHVSRGQLCYVIHDDKKETGVPMLGVFEPNGFAGCYFPNGDLRLYLDQLGGVEHDFQGGRKRRWSWKDQSTHVHAPPFQPICFSLNNRLSVRVMSQANIALTFRDKNRSCRFSVGAKLKLVNPGLIPPKEVDEDLLYINEVKAKVETLLNRVSNLLKFPKSPKLDKMKLPLHVTSMVERNEKLRTQAAGKTPRKESNITTVVSVN
ncbi:uncharacterized protein LOC135494629 isoform X2 [Lineus longissimus]|uniref:uncharacterized protein LOC135494629 isoform X2 n=1 Tax=Lineus longissimus TaxID=88925 RepID=UPI00315D4ADB